MSSIFKAGLNIDATDPRASRRIVISVENFKTFKWCAGDVVAVANPQENGHETFAVGILWPSSELPSDEVRLSTSNLLTAKLSEASQAQIFPLHQPGGQRFPAISSILRAHTIELNDISSKSEDLGNNRDWLCLLLRESLVDLNYITNSQVVEVTYEAAVRRFQVYRVSRNAIAEQDPALLSNELENLAIGDKKTSASIWTVDWDTIITVLPSPGMVFDRPSKHIFPDGGEFTIPISGLDNQVAQIKDLLEIPLTRPDLFYHLGLKPPKGILLYGPPGTGKTHLAKLIASASKSSVLTINGPELSSAFHGETESKLRAVFEQAKKQSPCIVVIDEVDALAPRRSSGADGGGGEVENRVVATLLTIMDGLSEPSTNSRIVIIGTTNRPNAIDPALRRPGRFDKEIEIGVPDASARSAILVAMLAQVPHSLAALDIEELASRAHGYVGADLNAAIREAGTIAIKRWLVSHPHFHASTESSQSTLLLTKQDLDTALSSVTPSAMRTLFLDTPPVYYSSIGGQSLVIQRLRECVEWPLLHPETLKRLGVKPPKGILLYGPPGCSKTVLARACATESGLNFVAVKGPEVLSKYLGESERAVREIFRRARAVSPSIVFFDEIDALATSRSSTGGNSHDGVLTSLLNEMDGVQELLGVTVIAATNRPEVIDSALIRPGRLDRALYVGPPDQAGREEILNIRFANMNIEPGVDIPDLAKLTDGCSGAEIVSLCQEAAMLTIASDKDALFVTHSAFIMAARSLKRQITPDVIRRFRDWERHNGLSGDI